MREDIPPSVRAEVFKNFNYKCKYCGSTEDLRIHHRFSVCIGGSNDVDNLELICNECHGKLHWDYNGLKLGKGKGGRKHNPRIPDWEDAIVAYFHGEIGKSKLKTLMGMSPKTHFDYHCKDFMAVKQRLRIAKFKNDIDWLRCPKGGGIYEGCLVAEIEYTDGRKEYFYYSKEKEDKWEKRVNEGTLAKAELEEAKKKYEEMRNLA